MGAQTPARDEILRAMRKAADFYRSKVSTEGGCHYYYTADLSYGRSESAEGPTQVEVQREATPVATLAYLDAYAATGGRAYLDYARAAAQAPRIDSVVLWSLRATRDDREQMRSPNR